MIRRGRPPASGGLPTATPADAHAVLLNRRRFLIRAAGGTVALLFGLPCDAHARSHDPWPVLDAVMRHLLPSEPGSPGAVEIRALDYLRFVTTDPWVDADEREFILQGSAWIDDLAAQRYGKAFIDLDVDQRELLLRQTAASAAGENWLSTVITYLLEALLTAPAYGGNPDGIGWRWLAYVPGFPLPGAGNRYPELPL